MHLRRKMKEKPPPTYFEVDPSSGILQAGQKNDIRIKFMPTEEVQYTVCTGVLPSAQFTDYNTVEPSYK